jgi:DNA modification methylase
MTKKMKVEMWPLSRIRPYANNARINDGAVAAVAASIREFGFRVPIVVDGDGEIIAGHTRWKAAHQLGIERVPVHVVRDLTPDQIRALRLADNRTGEIAKWDLEKLPAELAALLEADIDMTRFGFGEEEIRQLLDPGIREGLTDPDDIPLPPDEPITRPGDLWLLGEHRLLCGDSSKPEDVDRLLEGAAIDLVNTDPPYNVKVEPRSNNAIAAGLSSFASHAAAKKLKAGRGNAAFDIARGKTKVGHEHHQKFDLARHPGKAKPTSKKLRARDRPLTNDFMSGEQFEAMLHAWFGNIARVLEPGRAFFIWAGYANLGNYPPVLRACGLYFSQGIVWNKQHPVLTRKDFMGCFELAFYGWKEGAAHRFFGPNNAPDLWDVKKVTPQSMIHLTEKPVELAVRAMQYSSLAGENVLDLFGGSGSTLIAAEQTGRKVYLMEIDPLYCDVIVQRWEQFTGRKAQRSASVAPSAAADN